MTFLGGILGEGGVDDECWMNEDKCNENEMKIRVVDVIIEHSYVQWSMLEYENKRGPVLRLIILN